MIEASYTEEITAPVDAVWRFVEVIPNWAPFLVGFQHLELVDDRRSIWTLRGDVGVLAREVRLQADITRWDPLHGAEFTVTGLTERITGRGTFTLGPVEADPDGPDPDGPDPDGPDPDGPDPDRAAGPTDAAADRPPSAARPTGRLRRLRSALVGRLLRWLRRRNQRRTTAAPAPVPALQTPAPPAGAGTGPAGGGRSRLSLTLQLTPGGPMAPMVELLMTPMLEPAAEDFLRQLREALEHHQAVQ